MIQRHKKNKQTALSVIVLILGIVIMLYPTIAKIINQMVQTDAITKYTEQISNMKEDEIKEQKEQYNKYNDDIIKDKISKVNLLKQGKILGFIEIEKINVCIPIYEGTDSKTLQKGIGHLEKTTIPTKNYSYHSVFVGHSGLTSKKFFDDLDKLKIGDIFIVTILDEVFKYKIYDIKIVKPSETNSLKVQSNKKLVTLVTCTPKFVNSHRLLVMGKIIK